ncbi:MAG: CAP domain-containing protein [Gammaproteobacteria bacterium]|nr:CAP domain-containing protein [Gammaproteobacteria bacterium]
MLRLIIFFLFFVTPIYAQEININPKAMIKAHNELRQNYNSPPLIYSDTLEKAAEAWAKKLQSRDCQISHSFGETGENIYWASPYTLIKIDANNNKTQKNLLQNITDKQVVQTWYDEVKWYDYDTNSCQKGQICGHYTQVIWNTTKELGCAAIACKDFSQVWVCEYAPPGNIHMRHLDGTVRKLKPY